MAVAPKNTRDIRREGTALILPTTMSLRAAREAIDALEKFEETMVNRTVVLSPYHPADVATAFQAALFELCGNVQGKSVQSFFGTNPPQVVQIPVAPKVTVEFFWGRLSCPFDAKDGALEVSAMKEDGRMVGMVAGYFRQKHADLWDRIIQRTRAILEAGSIFRGRALRIRFRLHGDILPMPSIKPWNLTENRKGDRLVFGKELQAELDDNLFTPLQHRDAAAMAGIPEKRTVALTGPFGTGKSSVTVEAARIAHKAGMTVLYLQDSAELSDALQFIGAGLGPSLIISEDVDRIGGDDADGLELLLNMLDGPETKNLPVVTLLTTNYPERLTAGIVRPGRIDAVIEVGPPTADAALAIAKAYLANLYTKRPDMLDQATLADTLAGMIPASIREVCERAKLSHISRTQQAPTPESVTPADVLRAAQSMSKQHDLLARAIARQSVVPADKLETAMGALLDGALAPIRAAVM